MSSTRELSTFDLHGIRSYRQAPHPDISLSFRTNGLRVVSGHPDGTLNRVAALSSLQGAHRYAAVILEAGTGDQAVVVFFADRTPSGAYYVLLKFVTTSRWERVCEKLDTVVKKGASIEVPELVDLLDSTSSQASIASDHRPAPARDVWVPAVHYAAKEGALPARGGNFRASCKTMSNTLQHVALTYLPCTGPNRVASPTIFDFSRTIHG